MSGFAKMRLFLGILTVVLSGYRICLAGDPPSSSLAGFVLPKSDSRSLYYWASTPVGDQAQVVTLFCRGCSGLTGETDVPLVAVLRDTLADQDPENDRLVSVWLLSYIRPTAGRRILSAVPFFYWRVGVGSAAVGPKSAAPLINLNALQHPVFNAVGRDILQWGLLDGATTPIRASSRAYRTNEVDSERLHLEEAISYLQAAPISDDVASLTRAQMETLIARLELRKSLLGGLASEKAAERAGRDASTRNEQVRSRNWELLRQCADKTGLYFEPLAIAGSTNQYAMLWFPTNEAAEPANTHLHPIWKLLNIKDPWSDKLLHSPGVATYARDLDQSGNLLPAGTRGERQVHLTPLGIYCLTYPKMPLLLLDFRATMRLKWQEVTQRSIDEITAGVIGISHFTNWYYFVGADVYDFVASRHGAALNQSERLDAYAQFRVRLELDRQLDPALRTEMEQRVNSLAINPLEAAPQQEMLAALVRYDNLQRDAQTGRLLKTVDNDRRTELAIDSESPQQISWQSFLHLASFGSYTHRVSAKAENVAEVDRYRRVQNQLDYLDRVTENGTQPEVAYDSIQIEHAVSILRNELPYVESRPVRTRATATLKRLNDLTQDAALKTDCSAAVASLEQGKGVAGTQIALEPAVLGKSSQ